MNGKKMKKKKIVLTPQKKCTENVIRFELLVN